MSYTDRPTNKKIDDEPSWGQELFEEVIGFALHHGTYLIIGHPLLLLGLLAIWQPTFYREILIATGTLEIAIQATGYRTKPTGYFKIWADAWSIHKRWKDLWESVDRPRKRPMQTASSLDLSPVAPRLGNPRRLSLANGQPSISYKVSPARGRTFVDLEEQLTAIAAQHKKISKINLDYQTAMDSRATITFLLGEYLRNETHGWANQTQQHRNGKAA